MEHTVKKNHVQAVARAGPVLRALTGATLALLAFAVLAGCDKPTKPNPEKWYVYAGCASTGNIYILDAESLKVIDSIPDMREVNSIAVSPDGRWLYVQSHQRLRQSLLTKIDARTKEKVGVLPSGSYSDVSMLKGGLRLLRGDPWCQDEVVDPTDLRIIRVLVDSVCRRRGPASGTKVAVLTIYSDTNRPPIPNEFLDSVIRVTDVESGQIYGAYTPHVKSGTRLLFPRDVVLHPDGRRVLVIAPGAGRDGWFVIGNVLTGETLFQHGLASSFGEIAVSDDGSFAAVSDPGQFLIIDPNPPTLDIIDLNAMQHLKRFNMFAAQIRFFADGRKLLSGPRNRTDTGGALRVIDLNSLVVERDVVPFPGAFMGGIGVGRQP